jgi:hypothetical protein
MQLNEEMFIRGFENLNVYSFGRKIDFILKDSEDNELNTNAFKKVDISTLVVTSQLVKNLCNNAAVMVDSIKLTGDANIIVNRIGYVGDIGYT